MATYNFRFDGGVYRVNDNDMLLALRAHKRADETLACGVRAMVRILPPQGFTQDASLTSVWYSTSAQALVDHFLAMPGAKRRDGSFKPWFSYRQQPRADIAAAFLSHGLRVSGSGDIVAVAKPRPVKASKPTAPKAERKAKSGNGKPAAPTAPATPAIPDYRPNRDVALIGNGNGNG